MADAPENLIFEDLRRLDGKVERVIDDINDLKVRVNRVERRPDLTGLPH